MSGENMGYDTNGFISKQFQDTSFWLPATRTHPAAVTEGSARPALRPPTLTLGTDDSGTEMGPEMGAAPSGVIQQSWPPPYLDETVNFQTPEGPSVPSSLPSPHPFVAPRPPSGRQVGRRGFALQQLMSNYNHAKFSHGSSLGEQQSHHVGSLPMSQELSELQTFRQREMRTGKYLAIDATRMSSSLPNEFEKMQMMTATQEQVPRHEKRRLSDTMPEQMSPPERPAGSGRELKFVVTSNGIHNGPHINHQVLQSEQSQQLSQESQQHLHHHRHQQQDFVRSCGLSQAYDQIRTNKSVSSDLPTSTFVMETKALVDDADALVIKRFQEKVSKLDMGKRLRLQQSLLQLARHARKRQEAMGIPSRNSTDYAASVMGVDDIQEGTAVLHQSRVQAETQTNPLDRNLMNMLFLPLRLPGLQTPQPEQRSSTWTKARAAAAVSSQNRSQWSTSVGQECTSWTNPGDQANSSHTSQTQFLGGGRPGPRALEAAAASTTVHPSIQWAASPQLTDYASPPASSSSPVDPSMVDHRQADIYKKALGAVAQVARQLRENMNTTTQSLSNLGPRRCDSQDSSIASDYNSSRFGGRGLQFNALGPHDGQHIEVDRGANIHYRNSDRLQTSQNFATMMSMNADILGAAKSIQNRSAVNHISGWNSPPQSSSTSQNSSTKNFSVGFSPTLEENHGSHFHNELRGPRSLGHTSMSTEMGFFDQRYANVSRSMVDTLPYARPSELYSS